LPMDAEWREEASKEFLSLDEEVQSEVKKYVDTLEDKGLKWNKVGRVKRKELNLDLFSIKIMPDDNEEINHRVIFDVERDKFMIYKVGPRDDFYRRENLGEVKDRM
jgi:mRNA-degrading endonuclease RelE of RelBE toxin-antitoxin system